MMVRTVAGSIALLVLTALGQPLHAQTAEPHQWTPDRPDARAPMSITEARLMPAGTFQLSARYLYDNQSGQGFGTDSLTVAQVLSLFDVAPSEQITRQFALDFLWGVTDRLTLSAQGIFAQKTMDHLATIEGESNAYLFYQTEASGIRDVKVNALYQMLSSGPLRFHAHAGVSVPLGAIDTDDVTPFSDPDASQLPYTQQLGSGTFDLLPGFVLNVQNDKASLGIQGRATIRMGENDRGWALGDVYEGNLWAGYKATEWVSVSAGTRYTNWGNVEGVDQDLDVNQSPANNNLTYAGWRVDLPLGMNFVFPDGQFEGHRFGFEFLFPIHQDLDGPQLRQNWSLAAGWSMDLGL